MTEIAPGVRQKNEKTYYIQCSIKGTWHYCNKARLDKLTQKHGTVELIGTTYVSREGKADLRAKEPPKEKKRKRRETTQYTQCEKPRSLQWMRANMQASLQKMVPIVSDGGKCLRQDIFESRGNYCNSCPYWHFCGNEFKEWKTYEEQPERCIDQQFTAQPRIYIE